MRIAEEAQTSSPLRAVHQLGGEPSSLHSHIVPPTWQVTAKAQHLKPFSSPYCKHKLVLRKIFKKIIFSTAVFNGKCHLNSAGCTHYFACLAAVALGQVLKIRTCAQHSSVQSPPDPSLPRHAHDCHSNRIFDVFSSLLGSQSGLYLISRSMPPRDR